MKLGRRVLGWLVAVAMVALRATCRVRIHNDPRPALRASGQKYVYSVLHAHQVAMAIRREANTAAMVSRSADGELLMPAFTALGIRAVRGSGQQVEGKRGGQAALEQLAEHVATGAPALLAVDGPRGPRNHVRKGIAVLSRRSGAVVLNVVAIPTRRWVLGKSWDRLQIPRPFCCIDAYFAEPLMPDGSETAETYRKRIEHSLNDIERKYDPTQASVADSCTPQSEEVLRSGDRGYPANSN